MALELEELGREAISLSSAGGGISGRGITTFQSTGLRECTHLKEKINMVGTQRSWGEWALVRHEEV